ncbi:hypothetical protein F2P81_018299 [Scophthalmus maximus]|uniref:Uncharacterized protein n=2 Tax=Scophthalmus maximus TaxID=52904 RepID=A0A6A4SE81_SCOMX|nr:hypothetical protein F2P81_018299 [Scophthalmus maximus]
MGDSILDSLSLPPSGRAPSDQPTAAQASAVDQPGSGTQTSFITPVFGIISNKDIPIMISGGTRALRGDKPASSQDGTDKHCESSKFTVVKERQTPNGDAVKEGEEEKLEEERVTSKRSRGVKRKQPDERQSEFEEEEDVVRMTRSGKKRMGWGDRRTVESEEDGAETVGNEELRTAVLATCMTQMGVEALQLPENPSLCSIFLSCLSSQPRVLLEKLPVASACAHRTGGGGKSSYRQQQQQNQRKKSPVKAPRRSGTGDQPGKPDSDTSGLDDKENHPVRPSISGLPSQLRSNTETLALTPDSEDYVADSEDEATKNFKGRLFMKRYYKTRHGTFVPTLREYWKPGAARRDVLSAGGKRR